MKKLPLSQTNNYLSDPEKRKRDLVRSVLSSSAVEGIKMTVQDLVNLQQSTTLQSGSAR